jgi:hypothetical protein
MPDKPTEQSQKVPNIPGEITVVSYKSGDMIYIAMRIPNPSPIPKAVAGAYFDDLKKNAAKENVVNDRRFQFDGSPAIDLTLEPTDPSGPVVVRSRFVLEGDSTYNLRVQLPKNKISKDADRFLDSFKIDPAARAAAPPPLEWKTVAPPDAGFSISMPGTPQPVNDDEKILGHKAAYKVITPLPNGMVGIMYLDLGESDLEGGDDKALMRLRDDDLKRSPMAKLGHDRKLTVGGHPAREYEFESDEGGGLRLRIQSILVGKRVYQLAAAGPKADFPTQPASRFFASFKLTDDKAPAPKKKAMTKPRAPSAPPKGRIRP